MTQAVEQKKGILKEDEKFMRRCLQLASNGLGTTAPNPMVGCVIVHDGRIIGEGFTSPYGGPHAEVNAIRAVRDETLLRTATLYVSLEPCSHYGKTPPCADLIVQKAIPRVVVGIPDPHDKVGGKGVQKLKEAGCQVEIGVLKEACRNHHRRFLTFHEKKRPYIILKWAETADGFIAPEASVRSGKPKPFWITSRASRRLVHQWRSEEQAILVGTNTVLLDNPKLNTRDWKGKSPLKVVLDRDLKIPPDYSVFSGDSPALVLTEKEAGDNYREDHRFVKLDFTDQLGQGICAILYSEKIQSLIIEGGTKTLQAFIDNGLWDEARIFHGRKTFGKGLKAPIITGTTVSSKDISGDRLDIIRHD